MSDNVQTVEEPQSKPRILIVDDSPELLALIEHSFVVKQVEFEREYATTGAGALSLVEKFCFDCALVDLELPDLTGGTVFQLSKIDSNLPIAVFTNHTRETVEPVLTAVPSVEYWYKQKYVQSIDFLIEEIRRLSKDRRCTDAKMKSATHHVAHYRTDARVLPLPDGLRQRVVQFLAQRAAAGAH
jgi:DNA-binding response OmpR family regulator